MSLALKRPRKPPTRFGAEGILSESDEENSFERFLADDSLDDINYTPDKHEKVIATVKRVKKVQENAHVKTALRNIDFDAQFEQIDKEKRNRGVNEASSDTQMRSDIDTQASAKHTLDELFPILQMQLEQITGLNKKVDEMSIRISLMESKLIQNKFKLDRDPKSDESKQTQMFLKSNGLPIQTMDDLNRFEKNLVDLEFFEEAVSFCLLSLLLAQNISYEIHIQNVLFFKFSRCPFC